MCRLRGRCPIVEAPGRHHSVKKQANNVNFEPSDSLSCRSPKQPSSEVESQIVLSGYMYGRTRRAERRTSHAAFRCPCRSPGDYQVA